MSRLCRKTAMAAAAAAVMGAGALAGQAASAQPAAPPGPPPASRDGPPPPGGPGFMHRHGGPGFAMRGPMVGGGPLTGLVAPREDKAITADEATRIAEGLLLWMGEREWKIANAKQEEDVIRFDLTTKEGSRIATFTMDRRTGRLRRVG